MADETFAEIVDQALRAALERRERGEARRRSGGENQAGLRREAPAFDQANQPVAEEPRLVGLGVENRPGTFAESRGDAALHLADQPGGAARCAQGETGKTRQARQKTLRRAAVRREHPEAMRPKNLESGFKGAGLRLVTRPRHRRDDDLLRGHERAGAPP